MPRLPNRLTLLLSIALPMLAGCDLLGLQPASAIAAQKEAEGKAVGAACRHAGRAIEDCYALNRKADKAAIYAGWREMNDYMRENKIDEVSPQLTSPTSVAQQRRAASSQEDPAGSSDAQAPASGAANGADKPAEKKAS